MKNRIINVQDVAISISKQELDDYICITDIAKAKSDSARAAGGRSAAAESEVLSSNRNYEFVKALFESETEAYENRTDEISFTLQNVFDFMEAAFGDSQEMVAFITELNANYYSLWFIRENGSDQYYRLWKNRVSFLMSR